MNICRTRQGDKVGEVSSKYGYPGGGEQFETDMKAYAERYDFLWGEFVAFMRSHNVTPSELRSMFTRYYEEFMGGF